MKNTTDLMNELNDCAHIDNYFKKNDDSFIDQNLSTYLCQLLEERSLSKSDVVKNSDLNKVYAYQVLSGKRIIFGINKKYLIWQINEELYKHEYETI